MSAKWENFRGHDGRIDTSNTDIIIGLFLFLIKTWFWTYFIIFWWELLQFVPEEGGLLLHHNYLGIVTVCLGLDYPCFYSLSRLKKKKKDLAFQMWLTNKSTFTMSVCFYMCTVCFLITTLKRQYQPEIP